MYILEQAVGPVLKMYVSHKVYALDLCLQKISMCLFGWADHIVAHQQLCVSSGMTDICLSLERPKKQMQKLDFNCDRP